MVMPALPVFVAIAVVQMLGAPPFLDVFASKDSIFEFALKPLRSAADISVFMKYSGARLIYAGSVVVQIGVCSFAVIYFAGTVCQVNCRDRISILVTAAIVAVVVIFLRYLVQDLTIHTLTYGLLDHIIETVKNSFWLTSADLIYLTMLPGVSGIIAVVAAGAAACSSLRIASQDEKKTQLAVEQLMSSFRTLSAVLVTTIVALILFFQTLLSPFSAEKSDSILDLTGYANGLTAFWGAVLTMTLFAVYIGPLAVLYTRARKKHREEVVVSEPDLGSFLSVRDWLSQSGIEHEGTLAERMKNIAILMAPLFVGSINEILESI